MNANKLRGTIAERKALRLFREAGYDGLRSPSSVSKTDLLIKAAENYLKKHLIADRK